MKKNDCLFRASVSYSVSLCLLMFLFVGSGQAAFMNLDGLGTASWDEPATIKIFIPDTIKDSDRENFEDGIDRIVSQLTKIQVEYVDGNNPVGTKNFIDVNVTPPPGTKVGGLGGVPNDGALFFQGETHGEIEKGFINIWENTLEVNNGDFIANVAAHEFLHALGLDHNVGDDGVLTSTGFKVSEGIRQLSKMDRDMISMRYMLVAVSEPGSLLLLAAGALGIARFSRIKGQIP